MNYKRHKIELKEVAGKERYHVNYQHTVKLWFINDSLEDAKELIDRAHRSLSFSNKILSKKR